ncbi:MAG: gliding motility-associated C-terminal domain-containing protein [Saprospiraceae bacterium]|nr:gliding motility-associated C-terminal domain-containing protein [Saprospiraceae bacterium]
MISYIRTVVVLLFLLSSFIGTSQLPVTDNLIAYYPFNGNTDDRSGNSNISNGILIGGGVYECGVDTNSLKIHGGSLNEYVIFLGKVNDIFSRIDFSISFYIRPLSTVGVEDILAKREDCYPAPGFSIRYSAGLKQITAELTENASKTTTVTGKLKEGKCWHHVVLVRKELTTKLYIDGELKDQKNASGTRININNLGILSLADNPCSTVTNPKRFNGYIDELAIYDDALTDAQIQQLYVKPDEIANQSDTLIYLGNAVNIFPTSTCAGNFIWSPSAGVSDINAPDPTLSPTTTTTYTVQFQHIGCTSKDTIHVIVIDPETLPCEKAYLPNAFTPNGDGKNETFKISNPFVIDELISFEVFDRWGNRMFLTTNVNEGWDGTFGGSPVNPGVMLYKVKFKCNGEEKLTVGSVTVMR